MPLKLAFSGYAGSFPPVALIPMPLPSEAWWTLSSRPVSDPLALEAHPPRIPGLRPTVLLDLYHLSHLVSCDFNDMSTINLRSGSSLYKCPKLARSTKVRGGNKFKGEPGFQALAERAISSLASLHWKLCIPYFKARSPALNWFLRMRRDSYTSCSSGLWHGEHEDLQITCRLRFICKAISSFVGLSNISKNGLTWVGTCSGLVWTWSASELVGSNRYLHGVGADELMFKGVWMLNVEKTWLYLFHPLRELPSNAVSGWKSPAAYQGSAL